MNRRMSDMQAARYLVEQVVPTIRKHRWMIQGVFPTPDAPGFEFAYTVGLTEAGLPELVVTGFPHDMSAPILNAYADHHIRDEIKAGDQLRVEPSQVPFRAVDAPGTDGGTAFSLYGKNARFLQLVWPDKNGAYPGDPGWSYPAEMQPLFLLTSQLTDPPTGDGVIAAIDQALLEEGQNRG